jgi:DNA-binding CsgD family transcriptional regulator
MFNNKTLSIQNLENFNFEETKRNVNNYFLDLERLQWEWLKLNAQKGLTANYDFSASYTSQPYVPIGKDEFNIGAKYIKNKIIVREKESAETIFIEDDFTGQADEDIIYKSINQEAVRAEFKMRLTENEKILFELKFEKRLLNKDIAAIINKSEGAIKVKCTRIKQKLKNIFRKSVTLPISQGYIIRA